MEARSRRQFIAQGAVIAGAALGAAAAGAESTARTPTEGAGETLDAVTDLDTLERVRISPTRAPDVHVHERHARGRAPRIVEVTLEAREQKMIIDAAGTEVWGFTYDGAVPGPAIVVHEGDWLEITLRSHPDNKLTHNIAVHGIVGGLGLAALTHVGPGQQVTTRGRALVPGTFCYHCAPGPVAPMVAWHSHKGMHGTLIVLPRNGLADERGNPIHYDRAVYVGETDFYVPRDEAGGYKRYAGPADDMEETLKAMHTGAPSHVVFNGRAGALMGEGALNSEVGERILLVHSSPSRVSCPRMVGEIAPIVFDGGSFSPKNIKHDLETWIVHAGSASAAIYEFRQSGRYLYGDHQLAQGLLKGAAAEIIVAGEWNPHITSTIDGPRPIG